MSPLLPPLWSGVTLASFQVVGKIPFEIHLFINLVSDGAIAGAAIFNRRTLMPSAPVALPVGILSISFKVSLIVIFGKTSFASGLLCFSTKAFTNAGPKVLEFLSEYFSAKPVKCWLKASAIKNLL